MKWAIVIVEKQTSRHARNLLRGRFPVTRSDSNKLHKPRDDLHQIMKFSDAESLRY